jgi:hypothetical protein
MKDVTRLPMGTRRIMILLRAHKLETESELLITNVSHLDVRDPFLLLLVGDRMEYMEKQIREIKVIKESMKQC